MVCQRFGLNIYFAEIGSQCQGCVYMPSRMATDLPYDEEEQAKFYLTALKAFWDEPWFSGYLVGLESQALQHRRGEDG